MSEFMLGITGTDTGVGKTAVTCALLRALRARGLRVAGMKPIETGISVRGAAGTDAAAIREAAGGTDPPERVCPLVFAEPLAPMVAARRAGTTVDLAALDEAWESLRADRDAVLVEGAGGLLVPVTEHLSFSELFSRWKLDVLIVAANRLGVLNHARLTVEHARRSGLRVRAVVLTEVMPEDSGDVARASNADALRAVLPEGVEVVGFPFIAGGAGGDARALAEAGERVLAAIG